VITSAQLKAARALLGIDQRQLADLCAVSLPTIQRMEASGGTVRGVIDTLVKVVDALDRAGIELIGDFMQSTGTGRGVRLKDVVPNDRVKPIKTPRPSVRANAS
jgi:transcriptional regulator with XRE-family HTH domain